MHSSRELVRRPSVTRARSRSLKVKDDKDSLSAYFESVELTHLRDLKQKEFPLENEVIPEKTLHELFAGEASSGVCQHLSIDAFFSAIINEEMNDAALIDTLVFTFRWFLTDEQLLRMLIVRFSIQSPLRLSRSEAEAFRDAVVSKRQIKLLIILRRVIKLYRDELRTSTLLKQLFIETAFLCFLSRVQANWLTVTLVHIVNDFESVEDEELTAVSSSTFPAKSVAKDEIRRHPIVSLYNFAANMLELLESHSDILVQQMCLFDLDNLKQVQVSEWTHKAWMGKAKHINAPTLTFISEHLTRLSRFVSYALLSQSQSNKKLVRNQAKHLFGVVKKLIENQNFNSSYAIFMSITSAALEAKFGVAHWLRRQQSRDYTEIETLFSSDDNYRAIKRRQEDAPLPCVPLLAVWLSDVHAIEEKMKTLNSDGELNLTKMKHLYNILKLVESHKLSIYPFKRFESVTQYLQVLPSISEEVLDSL